MAFAKFALKRLAISIPVLVGLITISFLMARVIPGDPAAVAAGESAPRETIERIREDYGLDQPLWVQYGRFWSDLAQGDLGSSLFSGRSVTDDLAAFLPATIELALAGLLIGAFFGVALGVVAARVPGGLLDRALQVLSISGLAMPQFWLALLLQILAAATGILPISGRLGTFVQLPPHVTGMYTVDALIAGDLVVAAEALRHLLLPALALAFVLVGIVLRITRANMLDVVHKDYILNARASAGLPYRKIYYKYALKNALLPVVSSIGLNFGYLLSGSLLVETVYNWPGIGLYVTRAAVDQDFQPIIGAVLVTGIIYILVNLLTDLVYALLDPRIKETVRTGVARVA